MEEKLIKIYELTSEALSDLEKQRISHSISKKLPKAEKSYDMGIFQGSKDKAFSIAKKLIRLGLSVEEVSRITELSSFEIKNFINYD